MFNRIGSMVIILVLMVVTMSVQAGVIPSQLDTLTVVSANCEQIIINYAHSAGDEMQIGAQDPNNISTATPLTVIAPNPFSGSYTFEFSPPLEDGNTVRIIGEVISIITSTSSNKSVPNKLDIQGLSGGVVIAQTEFEITVSCDGDEPEITPVSSVIVGCNDGRLNQTACEPIGIYSIISDDGIGLDVWSVDSETSIGSPSVYVSAEELAAAQATGTTSRCTIATSTDGRTGVYLLAGGEIEVIHGPDFENKFFVFTFAEYPSLPTMSTYVGLGLPSASAC